MLEKRYSSVLLARHGQIRAKAGANEQATTPQAEIHRNVESAAIVYTDEAAAFRGLNAEYAHEVINHSEEYVRDAVHTTGIETFWANFRRTVYCTHHFVMPWHWTDIWTTQRFSFNQRKLSDFESCQLALAQADGRKAIRS
jgi:hypothetical protein